MINFVKGQEVLLKARVVRTDHGSVVVRPEGTDLQFFMNRWDIVPISQESCETMVAALQHVRIEPNPLPYPVAQRVDPLDPQPYFCSLEREAPPEEESACQATVIPIKPTK